MTPDPCRVDDADATPLSVALWMAADRLAVEAADLDRRIAALAAGRIA